MLNELSQCVESLDRLSIAPESRHPRVNPMSKNQELVVVLLDGEGKPAGVEVLSGEIAARLFRIEHPSAGSSFPGFNLPTPLRCLKHTPAKNKEVKEVIEQLVKLRKSKSPDLSRLAELLKELFNLSMPRSFTDKQKKQFQRSCVELVKNLQNHLSTRSKEIEELRIDNFMKLVEVVLKAKPNLDQAKPNSNHFADSLATILVNGHGGPDAKMLSISQDILFGELDWKKRTVEIGSQDYWREKAERDENSKHAIYLDLLEAERVKGCLRVAHASMSGQINKALLHTQFGQDACPVKKSGASEGASDASKDAFGESGELQKKFPNGPKVAELGNVKLFSLNIAEVRALQRYRLESWQSFPVTEARVQRMSDTLLYLAGEGKRGITCQAIPSAQPGKRDLLVAYLEGEFIDEPLAKMFGGEVSSFSDADFKSISQPVLKMLEGKVAVNPNLSLHLLSLCPVDKGKRQISLNRRLSVKNLLSAAVNWETGAKNVPEVSVWFYDKNDKKSEFRSNTTPCPIDLASVINQVWSADPKNGFASRHQRAFSVADTFDVFLADVPLAKQKTQEALSLLISRMSVVLAALGAVKTTGQWTTLSDTVRWQSLRTVALLGILLHQLGHQKRGYMQESITQLGRLLALADSLHLQYCKFVRTSDEKRRAGKIDAPSELIGNALFNTALDQPVAALARLAERIKPYKGWADTYSGEDAGLIHWLKHQMSEALKDIEIEKLPARTSDADKAKLLLGYLADHPKSETPKQ